MAAFANFQSVGMKSQGLGGIKPPVDHLPLEAFVRAGL